MQLQSPLLLRLCYWKQSLCEQKMRQWVSLLQ